MRTKIKISLVIKFLLPFAVLFVAMGIFLSYQTSFLVKKITIQQTIDSTVDFIQLQASRHIDSASVFSLDDPNLTKQVFGQVFDEIRTSQVVRIKVWDKEGTVIFSDDENIVGKSFSDNENFQETIKEGVASVEIKAPQKKENIGERGYSQLMEVYVPVTIKNSLSPDGIIETYYNLDLLNEGVRKAQTMIITINIVSFLALFIILWIFFRVLIIGPIKKLELEVREMKEKGT